MITRSFDYCNFCEYDSTYYIKLNMNSNFSARQATMFVSGEHCRCVHRFLSFDDAKTIDFQSPSSLLLVFMIRDCRAMRREAEKNIRDEIGEGQNAWQITRLVHRRNETKPRPRTRTPLCSHCTRVSLRGSQVCHSAGATVSDRHQITPDKGTTNWYHPNERRSPRKIRAAITLASITRRARGERDTEFCARTGVSLAFLDVTSDF